MHPLQNIAVTSGKRQITANGQYSERVMVGGMSMSCKLLWHKMDSGLGMMTCYGGNLETPPALQCKHSRYNTAKAATPVSVPFIFLMLRPCLPVLAAHDTQKRITAPAVHNMLLTQVNNM